MLTKLLRDLREQIQDRSYDERSEIELNLAGFLTWQLIFSSERPDWSALEDFDTVQFDHRIAAALVDAALLLYRGWHIIAGHPDHIRAALIVREASGSLKIADEEEIWKMLDRSWESHEVTPRGVNLALEKWRRAYEQGIAALGKVKDLEETIKEEGMDQDAAA